jgi:hypothetical protein
MKLGSEVNVPASDGLWLHNDFQRCIGVHGG